MRIGEALVEGGQALAALRAPAPSSAVSRAAASRDMQGALVCGRAAAQPRGQGWEHIANWGQHSQRAAAWPASSPSQTGSVPPASTPCAPPAACGAVAPDAAPPLPRPQLPAPPALPARPSKAARLMDPVCKPACDPRCTSTWCRTPAHSTQPAAPCPGLLQHSTLPDLLQALAAPAAPLTPSSVGPVPPWISSSQQSRWS